jgi:FlaG/FlaF family flagellin (archaellin)
MVAITVILAAVIAAFVFGMTGSVQSTKIVAVTAAVNNSQYLVVTFQGGADAATVENLTLNINGTYSNSINGTPNDKPIAIGASFGSKEPIIPQDCHAVVVAKFSDGSEQVVLDRNF